MLGKFKELIKTAQDTPSEARKGPLLRLFKREGIEPGVYSNSDEVLHMAEKAEQERK